MKDLDKSKPERGTGQLPENDGLAESRCKPYPPIIVSVRYQGGASRGALATARWIPLAAGRTMRGRVRVRAEVPLMLKRRDESTRHGRVVRYAGGCRSAEALPRSRRDARRRRSAGEADTTLPVLDRWAKLIQQVNG
jgi:hypothetical protein